MKRREFMTSACAAGLASWGVLSTTGRHVSAAQQDKQFFDLRRYMFADAASQKRFLDFAARAAIPALNRLGVSPVGVFAFSEEDSQDLYVLLPHPALESVVTLNQRLAEDSEFVAAGGDYLERPFDDKVFERIESSLLWAFDQAPKVEVPSKAESRVFQLRIYESGTEEAGRRKVEMFNEGGEIDVFRRCGMNPVFFGEAIVSPRLPHLTYMLGFDDREAGDAAWGRFRSDPGWIRLKDMERYKKTVSNITNIWLKPAACSQI